MAAALDPRSCVPSPTPTAAAFTTPVAHPLTHGPTPPFESEGSPRATDEPRKELEVESDDLDVKEEKPGVAAGPGSDELAQAAHVAHDLSRGKDAEIDFPDGGLRAWLVVAGGQSESRVPPLFFCRHARSQHPPPSQHSISRSAPSDSPCVGPRSAEVLA